MKNFQNKFGSVFILCLFIGFLTTGINLKSYADDLRSYQAQMHKAFNDENWQELKKFSEIVVKNYPKLDEGYFFYGVALDELGYYDAALENYTKALKIRPLSDIYQNRGYTYLKLKKYDEAIADFNKALELSPKNKLALQQKERAVNAKKGIVTQKVNNEINYYSINDPFYLSAIYKELPEVQKRKYINAVLNYDENVLPVYYLTVAEDIYPNDKKLAAFLYYIGLFRSLEDMRMCKNTSAHKAVFLPNYSAPMTSVYLTKMNSKEFKKLLADVLEWDEKYPNRPDPKWICYCGIDVLKNNGEVETFSESTYENIKKRIRNEIINLINTKGAKYKKNDKIYSPNIRLL